MTMNQYISVRETGQILGISEKKVMDLLDEKKLNGYRIANQFLRLKKSEVLDLRNSGHVESEISVLPYTFPEKLHDFFYYNDFYLAGVVVILILLYIIFYLE